MYSAYFIPVSLALVVLLTSTASADKTPDDDDNNISSCADPTNVTAIKAELLGRIKDDFISSVSAYNVPEYLENAMDDMKQQHPNIAIKSKSTTKVYQTTISGEHRCSKLKFFNRDTASTALTSTCPWYVVMETDWDRIPRSLFKAKCSCRRCLPQKNCMSRRDPKCKTHGRCVGIPYHIPVIRRSCVDGEYLYEIVLENINAGCTCNRV